LAEVYYFLILNGLLGFKLWNDKRLHDDPDKRVNHKLSAAFDGLAYVISGWFLVGWDVGFFILFSLAYRWTFFDLLFNLINKWPWNYCGETSKLDNTVDAWDGNDNRCTFGFIIKTIILILSIILIWWNRFI